MIYFRFELKILTSPASPPGGSGQCSVEGDVSGQWVELNCRIKLSSQYSSQYHLTDWREDWEYLFHVNVCVSFHVNNFISDPINTASLLEFESLRISRTY